MYIAELFTSGRCLSQFKDNGHVKSGKRQHNLRDLDGAVAGDCANGVNEWSRRHVQTTRKLCSFATARTLARCDRTQNCIITLCY